MGLWQTRRWRGGRTERPLVSDDVDGLRAALDADPEVVNIKVGENTMLELMTQPDVGPSSSVIVDLLVQAGAELDRALNLAGCWNLADLCTQLLAVGTDPSARADAGITPLESAAMHGSTEAADALVAAGLHRPSLWLAAASGQQEQVQDWVSPDGRLTRSPGVYRPDWAAVGRPPGDAPSDDPEEILGEALVFAAANDRRAMVDYLHSAGVDLNARPYRHTTGLHFAIQFHKPDMVKHLLRLGADPTIPDDNHNSDAAGWATACDDGTANSARVVGLIKAQ